MKKVLLLLSVAALALALFPAADAVAQYRVGSIAVTFTGDSTHRFANVYVDGERKGIVYSGRTATFGGIQVGQRVVQIRNGADSNQSTVYVARNQVSQVSLAFAQTHRRVRNGSITVSLDANTMHPSATVYMDGQRKGRVYRGSSLTISDVPQGQHEIAVQYGNDRRTGSVNVYRNQNAQINMTFGRVSYQKGTLVIRVASSGTNYAAISINGKFCFNVYAGQPRQLQLRAGRTYTVTANNGGGDRTKTAYINAGQQTVVSFRL